MPHFEFYPPGIVSTLVFLAICAWVLGAYFFALKRSGQRVMRIGPLVFAWPALLCVWVASGVVEQHSMPLLMIFFIVSNLAGLGFGLSRYGGRIASTLPFSLLIAFQFFRLPLELVLHQWAIDKVIPETMTWTGQNWDIVSGVFAIPAALLADRRREVAWVFNIAGFGLLLNVARVAVFSSPVPFGWDIDPRLLLAFHVPYALIVPVCVGGALGGHVILTRKLLGLVN